MVILNKLVFVVVVVVIVVVVSYFHWYVCSEVGARAP